MITCYIIDDEQHAIDTLAGYINRTPELVLVGSSTISLAGGAAVAAAKPKIDLCFVDISMPEVSGIELAGQINRYTNIVFISAFSKYAGDILEKMPFEFLEKPISTGKFLKCIERFKNEKPVPPAAVKPANYIFVGNGGKGKLLKIDFASIRYIESSSNEVYIHTNAANGRHTIQRSLSTLVDVLPKQQFSRIHKSYIVNHDMVDMVEGSHVVMDNKAKLPLGSGYREAFLKSFDFLN